MHRAQQAPCPSPLNSPRERPRSSREDYYPWIFAVLVLVSLAPIWVVDHLPTLDGPAHLYIADVLVRYADESNTHLHEFFELHSRIEANYIIYPLLWALLHIVPAATAEKLLLTIYLLFFAASAIYLSRSINREDLVPAFLFLPLGYTPLFVLGFYNLSFGIAVFMLYLGFWWRNQGELSVKAFAIYGLLAGLAYLSHLLALSLIGLMVATLSITWLVRQRAAGGDGARLPTLARGFLVRTCVPAATALPLWLAGVLVMGSEDAFKGDVDEFPLAWPSLHRVTMLLAGTTVTTHGGVERIAAAVFVFLLLALAVRCARSVPRSFTSPLFALTAILLTLYLFLPSRYVISWMEYRLAPFVLISLVSWLAACWPVRRVDEHQNRSTRPLTSRDGAVVVAAMVLVVLLGAGGRADRFLQIDALTDEYVSAAAHIEPRSTILALRLLPPAGADVASASIFLQTVGYVAIQADGIDLKNYQLQSGVFPVRYRAESDPYDHLASDAQYVGAPETVAPSRFHAETGRQIDYILLWGDIASLPPESALAFELGTDYRLQYASPGGLMRVFRRLGDGEAP